MRALRRRLRLRLAPALLALGVALGPGGTLAAAGGLLDADAFTLQFLDYVLAKRPRLNGQVLGQLEVVLANRAGATQTLYLANTYAVYRNAPDAIEAALEPFLVTIDERFEAGAGANDLAALVPVVKHRDFLAAMQRRVAEAGAASGSAARGAAAPAPYWQGLNSDLAVLFAFDTPSSLRYASTAEVLALGADLGTVRERAVENLYARLSRIIREGDAPLFLLSADGNFEASLMLFDDIWTKDNFAVAGDFVVFVPSRGVLLITGSEEPEGLREARAIVAGGDWPYPVASVPFVRRAGRWVRF